jgi:hypothetical protein
VFEKISNALKFHFSLRPQSLSHSVLNPCQAELFVDKFIENLRDAHFAQTISMQRHGASSLAYAKNKECATFNPCKSPCCCHLVQKFRMVGESKQWGLKLNTSRIQRNMNRLMRVIHRVPDSCRFDVMRRFWQHLSIMDVKKSHDGILDVDWPNRLQQSLLHDSFATSSNMFDLVANESRVEICREQNWSWSTGCDFLLRKLVGNPVDHPHYGICMVAMVWYQHGTMSEMNEWKQNDNMLQYTCIQVDMSWCLKHNLTKGC